jgi:hypothetical protein
MSIFRRTIRLLCLAFGICFGLGMGAGCGKAASPPSANLSAGDTRSDRAKRRGGEHQKHREPNVVATKPSRGQPVQWKLLSEPKNGVLRIGVGFVRWCPEIPDSEPRIVAVKEKDKKKAILLTAYLVNPSPRGCAEVAYIAERVVRLRTSLNGRPIYDGSQSPPAKRWPSDHLGQGNPQL